jgi:hypothetical protein
VATKVPTKRYNTNPRIISHGGIGGFNSVSSTTITNHLLFYWHHAKSIRIVYLATGLTQPRTVTNMLGSWLYNSDKTKNKYSSFLHAIFRARIDYGSGRKYITDEWYITDEFITTVLDAGTSTWQTSSSPEIIALYLANYIWEHNFLKFVFLSARYAERYNNGVVIYFV